MTEVFWLLFLFLYGGYSLAPDLAAKKGDGGEGGSVLLGGQVGTAWIFRAVSYL